MPASDPSHIDPDLDADTEITIPDLRTSLRRFARGSAPHALLDTRVTADQVALALDAGDEPAALLQRVVRMHGYDLELVADTLRRRAHPVAGDYLTALLQFVHTEGSVALRDNVLDELGELGLGRIIDPHVLEMSRHERLVTAILRGEPALRREVATQLVDHMIALPLVALVGGMVRRDTFGPAAQQLGEWLGLDAVRDLVRFVRLADDARSDLDLRAGGRCFSRATALIAPELLVVQLARLRRHLA